METVTSVQREVQHTMRGLGVHGQTSAGAPNLGVRDHDAGGELRSVCIDAMLCHLYVQRLDDGRKSAQCHRPSRVSTNS